MTRFERAFWKVEAARARHPELCTKALLEVAKVVHANYYKGRRQVLDAKTPTKLNSDNSSGSKETA